MSGKIEVEGAGYGQSENHRNASQEREREGLDSRGSRTDRLSRSIRENPRSGPRIIYVLTAVIVVLLAGTIAYSANLGRFFAPPYPSEDTPIELTVDGVLWTCEYDPPAYSNYSHMKMIWVEDTFSSAAPVVAAEDQELLSTGVSATVDNGWATVTDVLGDGRFGSGDSILFKCLSVDPSAFPVEDSEYVVALVYASDEYAYSGWTLVNYGEFSWAVHDGEFYSWESQELAWQVPWWYDVQ